MFHVKYYKKYIICVSHKIDSISFHLLFSIMSAELNDFEDEFRYYHSKMAIAKSIMEKDPEHKIYFKFDHKTYTARELFEKGIQIKWADYFVAIIEDGDASSGVRTHAHE